VMGCSLDDSALLLDPSAALPLPQPLHNSVVSIADTGLRMKTNPQSEFHDPKLVRVNSAETRGWRLRLFEDLLS